MNRRQALKLQLASGLALMGGVAPAWAASGPVERFRSMAARFVDDYLRLFPETATLVGDHRFDGLWGNYSPAGLESAADFFQSRLDQLWAFDTSKLPLADQVDADILQSNCKLGLFTIRELKEYQWNPLLYNPGPALNVLLERDFEPLASRLKNLQSRLTKLPRLLEDAKANLKRPPKIFTQTAIEQNVGVLNLVKSIAQEHSSSPGLVQAAHAAESALSAYGEWLKKDLLPRSDRSFRLGSSLFFKKLQLTLESDIPAEQVVQRAKDELVKVQAEMAMLARGNSNSEADDRLSDREITRKFLDKIADDRPDNATIVAKARESLERATAFVREKRIVTLPDQPCKVIEMPEFARGVAVAYCDSPGPLEKKGETFYAIAPTPAGWSPKRVESFYREYNLAMLDNLTVHEAMPGHFLQAMHGNRYQSTTKIRSIFGSGTFVEGWATYTEQVLANLGYGGPSLKMQQLKMRLRLILNAILDHEVHVKGISETKAVDMLMQEGFQEEGEAVGKWRRACLSSTQLSTYYVGNLEVNLLASDYKHTYPSHSMQQMHDDMLKFGSPACRYIRRLLRLQS